MRLGVLLAATVLNLTTPSKNGPIDLGSDNTYVFQACEQDQDLDPDV
jgi:hypothetical protein